MQAKINKAIYVDLANLKFESEKSFIKIDYTRLFIWLRDTYKTDNIFIFTGYLEKLKNVYETNKKIGYKYIFREAVFNNDENKIKANCDVDISVKGLRGFYEESVEEVVLVSSDGDYASLVKFWTEKAVKVRILSPAKSRKCSYLLRKLNIPIIYLDQIKNKINKEKEVKSFQNIKLESLNLIAKEVFNLVREVKRGKNKITENGEESHKSKATVIFLNGELGAGKTTFTKAFAKELKIKEEVISPTFILRKDYHLKDDKEVEIDKGAEKIGNEGCAFEKLIHIDAYRFEDPREALALDLDNEISKEENIILIEWADRFVKDLNIKADFEINIKHKTEQERDFEIKVIE